MVFGLNKDADKNKHRPKRQPKVRYRLNVGSDGVPTDIYFGDRKSENNTDSVENHEGSTENNKQRLGFSHKKNKSKDNESGIRRKKKNNSKSVHAKTTNVDSFKVPVSASDMFALSVTRKKEWSDSVYVYSLMLEAAQQGKVFVEFSVSLMNDDLAHHLENLGFNVFATYDENLENTLACIVSWG